MSNAVHSPSNGAHRMVHACVLLGMAVTLVTLSLGQYGVPVATTPMETRLWDATERDIPLSVNITSRSHTHDGQQSSKELRDAHRRICSIARPPLSPQRVLSITNRSQAYVLRYHCDRSSVPPLLKGRAANHSYILPIPMKVSYGLTNQLLCYAGLFQLAVASKNNGTLTASSRRLIPPYARTPLVALIDFNLSSFAGVDQVVLDPCEATAARDVYHKTRTRLRRRLEKERVSREEIRLSPLMARAALRTYHVALSDIDPSRGIDVWDMYQRWPFAAQPIRDGVVSFFCGLVFSPLIRDAAAITLRGIARRINATLEGVPRYIAVHVRMEPQDMLSQGRPATSSRHLATFFNDHVFGEAVRRGTPFVLICAGTLPDELMVDITRIGAARGIVLARKTDVWREILEMNRGDAVVSRMLRAVIEALPERKEKFRNRQRELAATNTKEAAVDALLLQYADVAFLTAYSSLTSLVVTRRCCDACARMDHDTGAEVVGAQLFDVLPGGALTDPVSFYCGLSMPPYVEATDLVNASSVGLPSYYDPDYHLSNPIFQQHHQRNRGKLKHSGLEKSA